ncbi:peptide chain release factor 1 [Halanaerobium saccharolyticum]|jgi:peptide chain release factor 1|uniref:Peptide chain release factor 1 n=1 Tax=Halanaerobium saccharolyticum TaxID=43595 RepID=A0A2T5RT30_9FIRM|nr:peptide chain release factor 1 [Halanaerobium saccharolyticum]OEG62504.1 MAG: peptide chain release factor 1 [Halanaerobium sp. MDAL1]PTW03482.1 peptide chain release factor 1 (bRF-1) [Halanaerobium saccharolyticum]PUU89980.1 MAG: peptide chain release factor 1 [Halanaerobium sp.]
MFDLENLEEKLDKLVDNYKKLNSKLSDPEVINDSDKYQKLLKKHAKLKKIVDKYKEYKEAKEGIQEAEEMMELDDDPEMQALFEEEIAELKPKKEKLEEKLPIMLLPDDPNDEKNVIVEIRAGAGGDEAALFAADLYRMYTRYAEGRGWKVEIMSANESGSGGFKEIIFTIEGTDIFKYLKYESGVHRVQRVPSTESSGRIHTSTATVAVLPEAEEVDVEINTNDLTIDTFRSSGPGGQSVNTTDSAIRITHEPTGLTVSCQDEKSQHKNKAKAMRILRARLQEKKEQEKQQERAEARKSQVGTGDRSEKIRTYNFPQGRVSDHRINLTVHQLDKILDGDLDQVIEPLIEEDNIKRLEKI